MSQVAARLCVWANELDAEADRLSKLADAMRATADSITEGQSTQPLADLPARPGIGCGKRMGTKACGYDGYACGRCINLGEGRLPQ